MWWSINSFSFIKRLFSTPQTSLQRLGKLRAMQGRIIRLIWFLWLNWCNIFNELCSGTIRILYLVNLLFLKMVFILISLLLLLEILNSCVSGKYIESICHFFCPFISPSVCHAPYLRNRTSSNHNFCYTCVKWRYLQVLFSFF